MVKCTAAIFFPKVDCVLFPFFEGGGGGGLGNFLGLSSLRLFHSKYEKTPRKPAQN